MFVRQGEADGGFFVGWFETEGQLVFGGSFRVMSGAVVDEAEADVTGGTGIPELDGIVASALRGRDPLLLFGVVVLEPIAFAEDGFGHAEIGIELESVAAHQGCDVELLSFRVIQHIPLSLQIILVSFGVISAVIFQSGFFFRQ